MKKIIDRFWNRKQAQMSKSAWKNTNGIWYPEIQDAIEIQSTDETVAPELRGSILDEEKLKSALERPSGNYFGQELFPELENKAAALIQGIGMAHAFQDGNKRTSYQLGKMFLNMNGFNLGDSPDIESQILNVLGYATHPETGLAVTDEVTGEKQSPEGGDEEWLGSFSNYLRTIMQPHEDIKPDEEPGQIVESLKKVAGEDFVEREHPRDEGGKFVPKYKDRKTPPFTNKRLLEHIRSKPRVKEVLEWLKDK